MKRKRQVEIILEELFSCGVDVTNETVDAVKKGLKRIRIEKFSENQRNNGTTIRNPEPDKEGK